MNDTRRVRGGRRTLDVHRPDKVLFPGDGGPTKADLAEYCRRIARYMVPELKGRPLMLERHPEGIAEQPHFMQKDTPDHYPDWVHTIEVAKEGGTVRHIVCDDAATLVFLADQACVTVHRWMSTTAHLDNPDRLVFDLDPPGHDFEAVRHAARRTKELLDELKLPTMLMTTGSRGLHVTVPLDGRSGFDDCRAFARDVAEVLAARDPGRLHHRGTQGLARQPPVSRRPAQRLRPDRGRALVGTRQGGRARRRTAALGPPR